MLERLVRPSAFKVALAIGLVFAGLQLHGMLSRKFDGGLSFLETLERKAIDVKFRVRGPLPLSHRVALAEVDERAVARYGLWPWNRALLARAIQRLADAGAASIALDMVLSDTDRNSAYRTLSELRGHLRAPDASTEQRVLDALARTAPSARAELEPAVQALLSDHRASQASWAELDRLVGRSPDQEMHEVVDRNAHRLVLGAIGYSGRDLDHFTPAQLAVWRAQAKASVLHGAFELDPEVHRLTPAPPQPWNLWRYDALEVWNTEVAGPEQQYAFFSSKPDPDGTMRTYTPVRLYDDGFIPSLAVAAVARPDGFAPAPVASWLSPSGLDSVAVTVGSELATLPTDPLDGSRTLINYVAPNAGWLSAEDRGADGRPVCQGAGCDRLSLADVIDGAFDPAMVKGKVVFVSVTAVGTFDQRVTPYDDFSPGVFVHMNVAEDLLGHRVLQSGGALNGVGIALALGLALLYGLLLPRLPLAGQLAMLPVGLGGYLGANQALFNHGTQLVTVGPLLEIALLTFGIVFFQYVSTDREKRQVRSAFQHYLTESVMQQMLEDPSKLKLGGEKKNLTVLFSDIRGFTTLSEALEPGEVARKLNAYLTPMTHLVFETGGTLDKYMGDAVMAFWGAPVDQPDHALRACQTACAMLEALDRLRVRWREAGEADIDIGIGLNSGNIHVGNMGSDTRFDYTVIGDDVNLASRLEGINKSYGTRVIIGENTYRQVQGRVVARELGGVVVKGKKKPVTIYELRRVGAPTAEEAAAIAGFERGLAAYRARDWDAAEAAFRGVQRTWPSDGPSEKYLEDIADKRAHPPDAGWDGVYVMKTK